MSNSLAIFWEHILELKSNKALQDSLNLRAVNYNSTLGFCEAINDDDLFSIGKINSERFAININLFNNSTLISYNNISGEMLDYIRLYAPLIFARQYSNDRPFIAAHLAQTLDGKICTCNGKSKWISNDENLDHAHRLRAISDAVLVGSGTIKNDNPQLNVRRVKGSDPIRLFWSNTIEDFSSCAMVNTTTILIRSIKYPLVNRLGIDSIIYYEDELNGTQEVLIQLKKIGIHSIFVEGGSHTISQFHKAQSIDLFQIHIAPIMFGSGLNGLEMTPIEEVSEALKFDGLFIKMGDHVMYSGRPIY